MKKLRIGALSALVLLCAALLGSMAAASAAAPAAHVTAYMQNIYVDGQEAKFANAEGKTTYLFSYNGTVYMPANTAAKWLGCTLSVDRAAGKAAFTTGQEASIPGPNSTVPSNEADFAVLDRYFESGADVQLLSQFTVTVDGSPWTFASGGTALYPFFVDDTLYLPLRSVGERMGKVVTWVPELAGVPHYQDELISIDTPATQAQLQEMQTYLDQAYALYWKAAEVGQVLVDASDLPGAEAADMLDQIKGYLRQIGQLPSPSHHYLDKYAFPELAVSTTVFSGFDYYSAALRANTLTFQEAVNVKDSVSITLMGRYAKLNDAQKDLSCFAAAIDAAG
ncbi:MAG TPA: copper amine oxidase N-terminal domain-containing protein [Candidatus Intestinimonas stercorigallinarum]|nr:copper amine oxidase N-terminal domain-containing protein [Candidatus Intestinimonas stercorigallinarum]